ncbi:MAG: class I SAM-dependent methyltransferase [Bacteroidetes bacterium]|nr:class I SAM-dependent methyltransferase [Bacteroidota bacterium]
MSHLIEEQLIALNIIDKAKVTEFYPRVRDNDKVKVLKCAESGVIYLSSTNHIADSYYTDQKGTNYWSSTTREEGLKTTHEDDHRRFNQFKDLVKGKSYLDVGSGLGGVLDLFKTVATEVSAVEPQAEIRELLNSIGYKVYGSIESAPVKNIDVISLFHVFEHLTDPLNSLKQLHNLLTEKGKIIIEVPHARDVLIETYNSENFKGHTFWSEHLILHTRKSLETFLANAGFKNIKVTGFQRYPLANHLHWLNTGKPGGQVHYAHLRTDALENEYAKMLNSIDQTDTIIAIAEK